MQHRSSQQTPDTPEPAKTVGPAAARTERIRPARHTSLVHAVPASAAVASWPVLTSGVAAPSLSHRAEVVMVTKDHDCGNADPEQHQSGNGSGRNRNRPPPAAG